MKSSLFYLIFSLLFLINAIAGTKLPVNIKWDKESNQIEIALNQYKNILHFEGGANISEFDYLPVYGTQLTLNTEADLTFRFINPVYEIVNMQGIQYNTDLIKNDIEVDYQIHYYKKIPIASMRFVPLRKNNFGVIERLVSAELDVTIQPKPLRRSGSRSNVNWANSSVMSSGNWYKIAVSESGIYKIDFNQLSSMGIDPSRIDPREIRIYGNGGGMLPEENADFRYGELQENAIMVVGENDGIFNQGDYILFYAGGPHSWSYNSATDFFEHKLNFYSDTYTYFVATGLGSGKRFNTIASAPNPNTFVTTFDDYIFHEKEEFNFLKSGREWYGDLMNFSLNNRNFNFTFNNIDLSTRVKYRAALVARSVSISSTFIVSANGQNLSSKSIAAVGAEYTRPFAAEAIDTGSFNAASGNINIGITFSNPSSGSEGWVNFLELNARRNLTMTGSQLLFRDKNSINSNNISQFTISNANNNLKILDITNPTNALLVTPSFNGNTAQFAVSTEVLKQFVAFYDNGTFPAPVFIEKVNNQNLHAIGQPDMLIITNDEFYNTALSLANFHIQNDGMNVKTIKVKEIFNEFSSGTQDISAIRDFVRMIYDKAGTDTSLMPKYLLLFGAGSYDYKDRLNPNFNLVPTYESPNAVGSLDPIRTFNSDDYYGVLDEIEGGLITDNNDFLDIAIGRIPARTISEAQVAVNKILGYKSPTTLGAWRNEVTFIADDEDANLHFRDTDAVANLVDSNYQDYNINKIYFDAFTQVSTPGGTRYPDVKSEINRKIFSGTLIMAYVGHGGVNGLSEERVLDASDVDSWDNPNKLPLFVTATCELSKYDDPDVFSVGQQILLRPNGGSIAMVTTLRLVFASANRVLNEQFFKNIFKPLPNGFMPTLGESVSSVKNAILLSSDDINLRKFALLGDPALRLNYPTKQVITTSIAGPSSATNDTLKALTKITISGEVRDESGIKISNFNGFVQPTIFDKKSVIQTLKNDPGSNVANFEMFKNIIYRGNASVTNGEFSFTFVVPKDISASIGSAKISYYAHNGSDLDANGFDKSVVVGGIADSFALDNIGPTIKVFMNDEKFAFGGLTDESPLLLVVLEDDNGINTVGTSIGHDITGVLDENNKNTFILNDFYTAKLDNFQRGEVRFPMEDLPLGRRGIRIKAWDVYNNSSEGYTEFIVVNSAEMALGHVLNYPNPFTTSTNFHFEHNKPGQSLFVQVKIFTVTGKLIKTIQQDILSESFRVDNIHWDGRDDYGDRIGRGVYVYKVSVNAADGSKANKFEKLVILK